LLVLLTTVHCFGKRCVNTRVKLVKRLATSSLRDLKRLWLSRRVRVCVYVVTAIEIMIHDLSRFLGPLLFDCFTSLSRAAGFPLPLLLVYFFRQVPWCRLSLVVPLVPGPPDVLQEHSILLSQVKWFHWFLPLPTSYHHHHRRTGTEDDERGAAFLLCAALRAAYVLQSTKVLEALLQISSLGSTTLIKQICSIS
jgi:hypothetical protein